MERKTYCRMVMVHISHDRGMFREWVFFQRETNRKNTFIIWTGGFNSRRKWMRSWLSTKVSQQTAMCTKLDKVLLQQHIYTAVQPRAPTIYIQKYTAKPFATTCLFLPQIPLPDIGQLSSGVQHGHVRTNVAHVGAERAEPAVPLDVAQSVEIGNRRSVERLGGFPTRNQHGT